MRVTDGWCFDNRNQKEAIKNECGGGGHLFPLHFHHKLLLSYNIQIEKCVYPIRTA